MVFSLPQFFLPFSIILRIIPVSNMVFLRYYQEISIMARSSSVEEYQDDR